MLKKLKALGQALLALVFVMLFFLVVVLALWRLILGGK